MPVACFLLTHIAQAQGDYSAAQEYAQQAYAAVQIAQNRHFTAYCLDELGNVARVLGDYAEAWQHYHAAYTIRAEFNDTQGMAIDLLFMGKVAFAEADYNEARRLYQRSFAMFQDIGTRRFAVEALDGLGMTAWVAGDHATAAQAFAHALDIAATEPFVPLVLHLLVSACEMLSQAGPLEWGPELLALIARHPAGNYGTRDRAGRLLARYKATVAPNIFAAAVQRGQLLDLDAVTRPSAGRSFLNEVTARLRQIMPQPREHTQAQEAQPLPNEYVVSPAASGSGDTTTATPVVSSAQPDETLDSQAEALSQREHEVLQLIAAGMSNRQIADRLVLSLSTVKWHAWQIYGKLGAQSRTHALACARELRLLGWAHQQPESGTRLPGLRQREVRKH